MREPKSIAAEVVTCLGEPLVLVTEREQHLAGAEANVAAGLVAWGVPAAFVGRIGQDEFGAVVRDGLVSHGVDIAALQVDPSRPTAQYSKLTRIDDAGEPHTISEYQRAGSAASAMNPAFLRTPEVVAALGRASVVHCSGITAALSTTCRELMYRLLAERPGVAGLVSFDVNWREQLWPTGDPAVVVELADMADLVLVGADEAIRVMGTDDPAALRRILPHPAVIVVKEGAVRAVAIDRDGEAISVPALRVDVVEPVGAGDAFAAGYLSGVVRGDDVTRCLRRGHVGAAGTLTVPQDSAPPPPAELLMRLLTCSDHEWAAVHASAQGFSMPDVSQRA